MASVSDRGRTKPKPGKTARPSLPAKGFHAVSVNCGKGACDAVRLIAAQRFLSNDAPRLPLPACTAATCGCRYVHFADRRDTDDRGVEIPRGFAGAPASPSQPDRRHAGPDAPSSPLEGRKNGWLFLAR